MADQRDPVGIAREAADMPMRPSDRRRAVLQEIGPVRLGRQPIVGNDDDEAFLRQRAAHEAIAFALAAAPAAAIEEDDHRQPVALLRRFGNPDVKRLTRPVAIGLVAEQQPRAIPRSEQLVGHVQRLGAARDDQFGAAAEQQQEQHQNDKKFDQTPSFGCAPRHRYRALQRSGAANKIALGGAASSIDPLAH